MSRNKRLMLAGSLLLAMAIAFFLFMLSIASKSNDPAELMRTVGTVSGVLSGISIAMMLIGRFSKRL